MNELFNQLVGKNPKHLWVQLSPEDIDKAKQQSQNCSNEVARWNEYINSICLNSLVEELQQVKEDLNLKQKIEVWPSKKAMSGIWELVNGSAIEFGDTRLVLIPSDSNNIAKFSVPQEWVDIPEWAGDYYLAVQTHLEEDECWLRVWGFTTHKHLKEGGYDANERSYSLDREDLVESLNVLWVARDVCPEPQPVVAELQPLASKRAEQLLAKLGRPSSYSPRLEVDFEKDWAPLITNEKYRQELLDRRSQKWLRLSDWFNAAVDEVAEAIKAARWLLPDEVFGGLQAGYALRYPREKATDATVRRVKILDFKQETAGFQVALMVSLVEDKEENTTWILAQVYPIGGNNTYLPEGLELAVVSEAGEEDTNVKAKQKSRCLQLNDWFGESPGTKFSIRVAFNKEVIESFQI